MKRIEIPEKCTDCQFSEWEYGSCKLYDSVDWSIHWSNEYPPKPLFCKATHITVHEGEGEKDG